MTSVRKISTTPTLDFYSIDGATHLELPFFETLIPAGFPSPAEDHLDIKLDLNKQLIRNPAATFFARVAGNSMIEAGIHEGDILVIDRSVDPADQDIAVCYLDGEFTVKRIQKDHNGLYLMPANPAYKPIRITEHNQFLVWGVVIHSIHTHKP